MGYHESNDDKRAKELLRQHDKNFDPEAAKRRFIVRNVQQGNLGVTDDGKYEYTGPVAEDAQQRDGKSR